MPTRAERLAAARARVSKHGYTCTRDGDELADLEAIETAREAVSAAVETMETFAGVAYPQLQHVLTVMKIALAALEEK